MSAALEKLRRRANRATVSEAAEICEVSLGALEDAIDAGEIPTEAGDVEPVVDLAAVDRWARHNPALATPVRSERRSGGQTMVDMALDGKSSSAIARRFGCSQNTVRRQLAKVGIRFSRRTQWDDAAFELVWCQTVNPVEVAKYFGVSLTNVYQRADELMAQGMDLPRAQECRVRLRYAWFTQVWNTSATLEEAAERARLKPNTASMTATRARSMGFDVKRRPTGKAAKMRQWA